MLMLMLGVNDATETNEFLSMLTISVNMSLVLGKGILFKKIFLTVE